jgi:hypothetical protein
MAWITPQHRHHLDMVRYNVRLLHMDKTRLYNLRRQGTWCHEIKAILEQCGLLACYNSLNPGGINVVTQANKALILRQEVQWQQSRRMPKLDNYNKLKTAFTTSNYVTKYLNRNQRSAIARLYCGNLPLRVETGRYRNIPRHERLCLFCDRGFVEDEIHFVTECDLHTRIILELNAINPTMYPDREQFFIRMCKINPKQLGDYIIKALNARRLKTV